MKQLKKKWEQELDSFLPPLREDIKSAPIHCASQKEKWSIAKLLSAFGHRGVVLAGGLAMVVLLCVMIPALRPDQPVVSTGHPAAVLVEINPSVVFSVDENGNVSQVVAANADADVLLSAEDRRTALIGIPISDAVEKFVDGAVQLGYLDLSNPSVIRVSACEDEQTDLSTTLQKNLEDYFRCSGAYVAVASEQVDMEHFCQRSGLLSSESMEALLNELKEMSTFYFDRHQEAWEESYAEAMDIQSRLEVLIRRLDELPLIGDRLREELKENIISNLKTIFTLLNIDPAKLTDFETPTSYEEYLQRIQNYYEEKVAQYKEQNTTQRDQISAEKYEDFIRQIVEEYGSVQAYWESKK